MRALPFHRGFTLLEMILVIVLLGILATAVTPAAISSFRARAVLADVGGTLDRLRYASDRMAFEIRELASGSITALSATAFTFSRTDYAGVTTSRVVTISQKAPTFASVKGVSTNQCDGAVRLSYSVPVISPTYTPTLTDSMCSLTFAYYDQAGTVTATPANVRFVEFSLELAATSPRLLTDPANDLPTRLPYAQRTRIALRNQ